MLKNSLLSVLIASALMGCNGSSDSGNSSNASDSTTQPQNVEITAFDGYLKNALVFHDVNKNGVFDIKKDTIFGLTNESGKISIAKPTEGIIAVTTIAKNSRLSEVLSQYDPALYSGVYTIDQDFPNQPVDSVVVYSAPVSSSVISPITDLVVLEMAKSNGAKTESEAIEAVRASFDDDTVDLYRDFVANALSNDADAILHKTAQILAVSKANDLALYKSKPLKMAEEATDLVADIVADPDLDIRDNKIVAIVDGDDATETVINKKLKINTSIYEMVAKGLPENITSDSSAFFVIPTNQLFTDDDIEQQGIATRFTKETLTQLSEFGITAEITAAETLFSSENVLKSGVIAIAVEGVDVDANGKEVGVVVATFYIEINDAVANLKPVVNDAKLAAIQSIVSKWQIQEGVDFDFTVDVSELFTDPEGDNISIKAQVSYPDGVKVGMGNDHIANFAGSPHDNHDGKTGRLYFSAMDDQHGKGNDAWVDLWVTLPVIEAGIPVEPSTNVFVGHTLYMTDVEFIGSYYGPTEALAECHSWEFSDGNVFYGDYSASESGNERCHPGDANRTFVGTYVEVGDDVLEVSLENGNTMKFSHIETFSESFSNGDKLLVTINGSKVNDEQRAVEMYKDYHDITGLRLYSNSPCEYDKEHCFGNISQHITRVLTTPFPNEQLSEPLNIKVAFAVRELTSEAGYHVEVQLSDYPEKYGVTCADITSIYGGQRFVRIKSEFNSGDLGLPYQSSQCRVSDSGVILEFDINTSVTEEDILGITLVPSSVFANSVPKISVNMTYDGPSPAF